MQIFNILPPKIKLNKNKIFSIIIVLLIFFYYLLKTNFLKSNINNLDILLISIFSILGIYLSLKNKNIDRRNL